MPSLKRYDIKKLLANPDLRRRLVVESTRVTQAREDIHVSREHVENSYYVVTEAERAVFFDLVLARGDQDAVDRRHTAFVGSLGGRNRSVSFDVNLKEFLAVQGSPLSYKRLSLVGPLFRRFPSIVPSLGETKIGHQTFDDERFVRRWWEVASGDLGPDMKWVPFAKGGDFSRFYSDVYLVVRWDQHAHAVYRNRKSNFNVLLTSSSAEYLHREGLTWPRRTAKGFNMRYMPSGCVFGDKGPVFFPKSSADTWYILGILNSALAEFIMGSLTSFSWESGVIQRVPVMKPSADSSGSVAERARFAYRAKMDWDSGNEVSSCFKKPWLLQAHITGHASSLASALETCLECESRLDLELGSSYAHLNDRILQLYGIDEPARTLLKDAIGKRPPELVWPQMEGKTTEQKRMEHVCRLLTYAAKCVLEQDDDGLVALQPVAQEAPLLERVRAKLASFFPQRDQHTLEIELVNELKKRVKGYARAESLHDWLTDVFFDFHCALYQQRPILWHLASSQESAEPAFSAIVHYHRFDHDRLAKIRSVHVRDRLATLRREAAQAGKDGREDDRLQLLAALEEVVAFDRKLARLQEGHNEGGEAGENDYRILTPWKAPQDRPKGWRPDLDDGVKVNIAPLARTGLLRNKNTFGQKEAED